jgi:hypothetical protein
MSGIQEDSEAMSLWILTCAKQLDASRISLPPAWVNIVIVN